MSAEGYTGAAVIATDKHRYDVRGRLTGHIEPVDGRFHWAGRVAPDTGIAALVRGGERP